MLYFALVHAEKEKTVRGRLLMPKKSISRSYMVPILSDLSFRDGAHVEGAGGVADAYAYKILFDFEVVGETLPAA